MNYQTALRKHLETKFAEKKLAPSSITLYIRNLEKLNDNRPLMTLKFLSDPDAIVKKLEKYKENTKRGYLISIVSTLSLDKSTKAKQALYDAYFKLMMEKNKTLKAEESENKPTESQQQNWLSWSDVEAVEKQLKQHVATFKKDLTENEYTALLSHMVLALYTYLPPRRNEYQSVQLVKTAEGLPKDANYLDMDRRQFVLYKFKTSKKEGAATIAIPDELFAIILHYLKFHPLVRGKKIPKGVTVPFLVYYDGKPLDKTNSITRLLNKVFKKKVSSSMLRHVYLSNKYGDTLNDMKKDSEAMSHSLSQQKDYIKE